MKKPREPKQPPPKSDASKEAPKGAGKANRTLKTTGNQIPSCAGPIDEWIPCKENLPKHPTMVSDSTSSRCAQSLLV